MNKLAVSSVLAGIAAVSFAGAASATLITDTVDVHTTLSTGESVGWVHDFTDDPLFGSIGTITGGQITVSFTDNNDWWPEIALGITDGLDWAIGEVDTGDFAFNVGVSSLYDGIFRVRVISLFGDFTIDQSVLRVWFNGGGPTPGTFSDKVSVPEPGTLPLLGGGLLAAGFIGRRRRKHADS